MKNATLSDGRKVRGSEYCSKQCPYFVVLDKEHSVCVRTCPTTLDYELGTLYAHANSSARVNTLWVRLEQCFNDEDFKSFS